jgi:hypothetical protein
MADQFAPWITDPDDPADFSELDASALDAAAAMFPELVDKSKDGPIKALQQDAQGSTDPHAKHIVQTFREALAILDQSEPQVRDMIENGLFDVAGIDRTKVKDAMLTRDDLAKKIAAVRHHHIKKAFRHLRYKLPNDI